MAETKATLYWLAPPFERAVVHYSCTSPRFWARVGHAVDPECLNLPEATLAMRAARQIVADTGEGPASLAIVQQRLRRWMDEGKVKYEDCQAVASMFLDAAEDPPVGSEDAVCAELAPVLKKRIRHEVVLKAMDEAKGEAEDGGAVFERTAALIEKANALGVDGAAGDAGLIVGSSESYEVMEAARHIERLSTGIEDLDIAIRGGSRRGGFTIWLGGTGSGKSTALIHRCARAMRLGLVSALATLELTREDQLARLKANLTGVPFDDILADPRCVQGALSQMALGPCYVQVFTSYVTTTADIRAWVDLVERREGRRRGVERVPVDLLAVDYGDLLGVPAKVGKDADHGYTVGKHVYGDLRIYAEGEKTPRDGGHPGGPIWVDTAVAATRSKDKRRKLGTDDVSDSLHKARRGTLIVSINPEEEDGSMNNFFVGKNSHGPHGISVGPIPSDFAAARLSPVDF